jgi:hypothetical protein
MWLMSLRGEHTCILIGRAPFLRYVPIQLQRFLMRCILESSAANAEDPLPI